MRPIVIQRAQQEGKSDHILLLNNDAEVGPRCLEHLRWHLERHPRTAAVGPLTGDDGRQSVKKTEISKAARISNRNLNAEDGDSAAYRDLIWEFSKLSGFCLLLHGDAAAAAEHLDWMHPNWLICHAAAEHLDWMHPDWLLVALLIWLLLICPLCPLLPDDNAAVQAGMPKTPLLR